MNLRKNGLDYYAFGSPMPGRNYTSTPSYRYGFNGGSEKDDEIYGISGSLYTTEFRELDTRLGRWWSLDQIVKPWESPYAGFANNPIVYSDPHGLDPGDPVKKGDGIGKKGTIAPNGGTRIGDGSVAGGEAQCIGCGASGETIYGLPDASTISNSPNISIPSPSIGISNLSWGDYANMGENMALDKLKGLDHFDPRYSMKLNMYSAVFDFFGAANKLSTLADFVAPMYDYSQGKKAKIPVVGGLMDNQFQELDNMMLEVGFKKGYSSFIKQLAPYNRENGNSILGIYVTNAEFVQAKANGLNVHNISSRVEASNFAASPGNASNGDPYVQFIFFKAELLKGSTIGRDQFSHLPIGQ